MLGSESVGTWRQRFKDSGLLKLPTGFTPIIEHLVLGQKGNWNVPARNLEQAGGQGQMSCVDLRPLTLIEGYCLAF